MPMIDVYAAAGTFADKHQLFSRLRAERVAVDKHHRGAEHVVFVVDPDGAGISPADGDERHRDL